MNFWFYVFFYLFHNAVKNYLIGKFVDSNSQFLECGSLMILNFVVNKSMKSIHK